MAEQLKGMKDAVVGGQGGGLQSISTKVGETIGENSDTRGSKSKSADSASESLGQFSSGGKAPTTGGTSVKGADQVTNMQTGTANHLELGK